MLYIVATPIGNLKDITYRAIETLKMVEVILVEDTRVSLKLLNYYQIKKKLISFHSYSKEKKIEQIINLLKSGQEIALISDAGTPGISDPAYNLIQKCLLEKIKISPIPWPTALISALVVSGFSMDNFIFYGFFPAKKWRAKLLKEISENKYTSIFYESPHRINKLAEQMKELIELDRQICIARELTKKFEEIIRLQNKDLIDYLNKNLIKGELVILISGKNFKKKEQSVI